MSKNIIKINNKSINQAVQNSSKIAGMSLFRIKEEFPKIKWKKHRYLTHGWDHVIIILDDKVVFRTPKSVPKDLQDEFFDEIKLLNYLKKKVRVGIPEYVYISKDKSIAGYKLLAGRELKPSEFKRLSNSGKETIAKQLAGFITALHVTPKSSIKNYNVRIENDQKRYGELVQNIKKFLFPRLSKKDIQIIEQYFNELKAALSHKYPNVLIHNDLTWEHILWDKKKRQINIIDFSDRAFGDPAADFAGLLEYGQKFTERVFALYKGRKDEHLLERSQLYFKRIPLSVMKGSLEGYPCTFKDGYAMFKKRFKIYQ